MSTTNATIFGRLTRDPETRQVGEHTKCEISIAVDDGWGDNEHTSFLDVVAWGKTAETIGRHFSKGRQIVVTGEVRQDRWTQDDGSKRSKVYIKTRGFSFVSDGQGSSGGGSRREVESPGDSFSDSDIPF